VLPVCVLEEEILGNSDEFYKNLKNKIKNKTLFSLGKNFFFLLLHFNSIVAKSFFVEVQFHHSAFFNKLFCCLVLFNELFFFFSNFF
jgi:hypothetical protein